jgi:beta-lactamase regulating signal transducer with metallopeptidase domain
MSLFALHDIGEAPVPESESTHNSTTANNNNPKISQNQSTAETVVTKSTTPVPPSRAFQQRAANEEGWTPYRKMNAVVWILLLTIATIILHKSYNLSWVLNILSQSREWATFTGGY